VPLVTVSYLKTVSLLSSSCHYIELELLLKEMPKTNYERLHHLLVIEASPATRYPSVFTNWQGCSPFLTFCCLSTTISKIKNLRIFSHLLTFNHTSKISTDVINLLTYLRRQACHSIFLAARKRMLLLSIYQMCEACVNKEY
jgi:hypothetical protein